MKYFIFLIVVCFAVGSSARSMAQQNDQQTGRELPPEPQAQQGWMQQQSGTTEWLPAIFPFGKDTVWALGLTPLRTSDGGRHWLQHPITQPAPQFFQDDTTMFATRGDTLLKSTDAGMTWPIQSWTGIESKINAMTFIGQDTGYAMGNYEVARTYDGGRSWTAQQQGAQLQNLAFADSRHGFIVTPVISWSPDIQGNPRKNAAEFAYTSDAGVTWIHNYSGISQDLAAVAAIDDSTAVAVGNSGLIVETTDKGLSYRLLDSANTLVGFQDLVFQGRMNGWVVGSQGRIVHTADGGHTWLSQTSGVTSFLYAVRFPSDTIGFASGLNGVILRTTNGGIDWVQIAPSSSISLFIQSFPEPFRGITQFRYSLPQLQHVTIEVFDATGRVVGSPLQRRLQMAGEQTVSFDGSQLPSGAYSYRVQTDRFSGTGKFTIVR